MSADAPGAAPPAFTARAVLILIGVGVVAFSALAVLAAYAPELRQGDDGRAHALSRSAVGYAGAVILARELGAPVVVSRSRPSQAAQALLVLAPDIRTTAQDLEQLPRGRRTLIVLPKWMATPDRIRRGHVRNAGAIPAGSQYEALLKAYAPQTRLTQRQAAGGAALRGAGGPFTAGTSLPLGRVDRLQTVSGEGWAPALVDETGATVLAYSETRPDVLLLADPDLLNNQGLARLDNARAAAAILEVGRGDGPVVFDVTLNGFQRTPGLGRLALTPPWLAATLCGGAAALLMGFHALARFGPTRRKGRAIALGSTALVDNSAGLIRLARKEAEFAPAYAALVRGRVAHAAAGRAVGDDGFLEDLALRRGLQSPAELAAEAAGAKTSDDALTVARKLYDWRKEMTRGRG